MMNSIVFRHTCKLHKCLRTTTTTTTLPIRSPQILQQRIYNGVHKTKFFHTNNLTRTKHGTNINPSGDAVASRTKPKRTTFRKVLLGLAIAVPAVGGGTYTILDKSSRRKIFVTSQGFVRFFR